MQATPLSACVCTPTGSSCVLTDVQNTMVHELGHSIGLDHTSFPGSTMGLEAKPGETSKRTIDQGSRDFVCEVYPQGSPSRSCIVRPVEGTLGATASGCSALPVLRGAWPGWGSSCGACVVGAPGPECGGGSLCPTEAALPISHDST